MDDGEVVAIATGIPKKKGETVSAPISLSYSGIVPNCEVLQGDVASLAEVWCGPSAAGSNLLVLGENLRTMRTLLPRFRHKVRLVYIDPPFATGMAFHSRSRTHAYDDMPADGQYAEFLRQRLLLLKEFLAEDGSIYVHLDQHAVFFAKLLMDEVFGASQMRAFITRRRSNPKNYTHKTFGNVCDYLLFYSKSADYVWNRPVEPWTEERSLKEYQCVEKDGRRYKKVPVHAPGVRHGATGQPWRGTLPPPGKHWQYPPSVLDELDRQGHIYWSPTGNPRRKVYLDHSEGVAIQNIWQDYRDAFNQNHLITGYPTEKNGDMLDLIVRASSNRGDIVMDCFAGSGTTLEAAARRGRAWIGIDNSPEALRATLGRFAGGLHRMGDFVQKDAPAARQVRLFDAEDGEPNQERGPILDFSWMAEEAMLSVIGPLRDWWTEQIEPAGLKRKSAL